MTKEQKLNPFHLAMPVSDLEAAEHFYGKVLGFEQGRNSAKWIDFNFFGHQFVVHQVDPNQQHEPEENAVDGHQVPVPHFGVVLEWGQWHEFANQLKQNSIEFIIEPYIRFKGKTGEQATLFFKDPSGNALEFKAFKNPSKLFEK